jgi:hypothetical protein
MSARRRTRAVAAVLLLVVAAMSAATTCRERREDAAGRRWQELVEEDRAVSGRMRARSSELGYTGDVYTSPVGIGEVAADPEVRQLARRRVEISDALDALEAAHPRLRGRPRH